MGNGIKETIGSTYRIRTGCGWMYITINENEDCKIWEVFASLGKAGGCAASQCQAIGLSITNGLQAGVAIEKYMEILDGIQRCTESNFENEIYSCSRAILIALEKYIAGKDK